jgi:hypothetical protein
MGGDASDGDHPPVSVELNAHGGDSKSSEFAHANNLDATRGSELLSLLLKKPSAAPLERSSKAERSKTPPVQPTVSKQETSRPLTPPARFSKHAPGSRDSSSPSHAAREGTARRNEIKSTNGARRDRPVQRSSLPPHTRGLNGTGRKVEQEEGEHAKASEQTVKTLNELGLELKEGTGSEPQQVRFNWGFRVCRVRGCRICFSMLYTLLNKLSALVSQTGNYILREDRRSKQSVSNKSCRFSDGKRFSSLLN